MTPNQLLNLLSWISEQVSADVQIQTLRAFLFVASRGSCTQKDVEVNLQITGSSASRNISYWTHRRFDKEEGIGFIDRQEDDEDRRLKKLVLTPAGQAFYKKLKEKL
jgi:hypothetical protein